MSHADAVQAAPPGSSTERSAPIRAGARNTVRWLRVLLVAAICVPALLFSIGAVQDRNLEIRRAEERAQNTVGILHEHARNVFRTHELVLNEIDDRIRGMDWTAIERSQPLHDYLTKLAADVEVAQSVWLIDGTGHHRSNSVAFPAAPMDVSDRDYFRVLRAMDAGMVIGAPITGKATGAVAFAISRRRSNAEHRFDGVLSVAIAPSYFTDFYASIIREPSRAIALVRSDGTLLARDPPSTGASFTYGPQSALMQHLRDADQGVFTARGDMDGLERIYAYQRIKGYPAVILFGIGKGTVLSRWYRWLTLSGCVAAIASAGLFAVTWIALKRARMEDLAVGRMYQEMERRETAERERQEAENQLRQSQKMEAIGRLTGGIAHDFNNLLTVVVGNLELVLPAIGVDTSAGRRLAAAQDAAERGTKLTKQLLAFSRRQSLHPELVDLHSSVGAITDLLKSSMRSRVRVTTDFPPDLWPIHVDREQLDLAILNVAVNARDAMPNGGTLQIRARNVVFTGKGDRTACELDGDFVALTVSDTGEGIEPEILKHVFEPFFTTKEVGKGTGLGLSQVYGFAKQSGGKAAISSIVGSGTAVTIYLPRAVGEIAASCRQTDGDAPYRSCGTILLVEDEPAVADVAVSILEERGFTVIHAEDARRALELLGDGSAIDIVISDIVMPGEMTGIELGDEIRRSHPHMPVLLTTGYSEAMKEASRAKFAILHKPYRAADLLAAVDHCLEGVRIVDIVKGASQAGASA